MLVLTRNSGQDILIGEEVLNGEHLIRIRVLEVRPNGSVKIGLEGPDEIQFLRAELVKQKETAQ